MSAASRWARILNGFSSLISRRSAISRRMRAIATLSKPESFGFDAIVEHARAAGAERLLDGRSTLRRAVAEQTAAAAGAPHLRRRRPSGRGAIDELVDRRRRHARREPLAVLPFDSDVPSDGCPVAAFECRPQLDRCVADPLEAVEDMAIAVDVPLEDVPIVRAGVARRAGVGQHDATLERSE